MADLGKLFEFHDFQQWPGAWLGYVQTSNNQSRIQIYRKFSKIADKKQIKPSFSKATVSPSEELKSCIQLPATTSGVTIMVAMSKASVNESVTISLVTDEHWLLSVVHNAAQE